jgi:DNA-binding response OmpR family regulator
VADALRVLVVDDEVPLTRVAASYLEREGFEVLIAHTGPDAVDMARSASPDLLLLDVMLPGFDGIEVCRQVRQFTDAYIIILTARDQELDKVLGLSMGADDYLVKPFSPREMIARIRAMLRRPRTARDANSPEPLTWGAIALDPGARLVTLDGEPVELTRTEFDILAALLAQPRTVLTRRQLTNAVWGTDWYGDDHVVDVHVAHMRTKLGDDASVPRYVRTVRGVGYGMVAP